MMNPRRDRTKQRCIVVNTHLIRDAIFHDDFRLFFKSETCRVPDFSQAQPIDRNYEASYILHDACRTVHYRND